MLSYGIIVMSVTHLFAHVFDRVFPALMPIFRDEFSLTLVELGIIASIPYAFQTFLSIPAGYFTDKYGAKKAMTLSFIISIASATVVAISTNVWMLIFSISCLALVTTIYHPASYSYTTKIATSKNRSRALGLQNAGGPLGMSVGPLSLSLVTGFLGYGWRFVYFLWIIPIIIVLLAVQRLRSEETSTTAVKSSEPSNPIPDTKPNLKSLFTFGLVVFLVYSAIRNMGGQMISTFLPTYLKDFRGLSVADASLIYGSINLMGVFSAPLGGFLADRVGTKRWLVCVSAVATAFLGLSYVATTTTLFLIFYFLNSFTTFLGMAANSAVVASLTPSSQRGMGYALFFLPMSIVGSITPAIAGIIGQSLGLSFLFPLGLVISALALVMLQFGVRI